MGSMVWVLLGAGLGLAAVLGGFGYRYSVGQGRLGRAAEAFLWTGVASIAVMAALHELLGFEAFVALAAVDLALLWVAFRLMPPGKGAEAKALWVASCLLVTGSAVVWMGASTWPGGELSRIAANRSGYLFTTGTFFLGALLTLAGFVTLRGVTRERGERRYSDWGACALLVGAACWTAHLVFRGTVVVVVASQAVQPEWYAALRLWSGGMYAAYMTLAYLATAAFGAAMLKTGLAGRRWGRAFVIFGLVATAGFLGQTGAFSPPLIVQFMPYVMGIVLLRQAARGPAKSKERRDDFETPNGTPGARYEEEREKRLRMVLEKFGESSLGNLRMALL